MSLLKICFFIAFAIPVLLSAQNEICPSNDISTHPDNASNPNAPDSKFINEFDWYQQAVNNELFEIPIYDLDNFYALTAMLNPYDEANNLCYYLTSADLDELDVTPEEGWELLFINLGHYPDLTLLSAEIETSDNLNIPYIILYNKYRSIVRLFSNCKFDEPGFDEVAVTLKFNEVEGPFVSGLLRLNSGTDRTLDQSTDITDVTSYCKLPTNTNEWFHVDFQVAYDPCTCLYDSRLELVFTPISSSQIEIVNSDFPNASIDLRDIDGLVQASAIIPVSQRMITFHTMAENIEYTRVLAEKYVDRMADEGFDNSWYESLYSIFAVLEIAAHSGSNAISGSEINAAAQHAADMRYQWGVADLLDIPNVIAEFVADAEAAWGMLPADSWTYNPYTYAYTINLERVMQYCQSHLPSAQSFSSAAIELGNDENKFSITPSSSYANSVNQFDLSDFEQADVVQLLNPGTYPIQELDVNFNGVTAQNYPVYNEVLGLFAVLEQPKFDVYHNIEIVEGEPWPNITCDNTCSCTHQSNVQLPGPFTTERFTYSENHNSFKFRLSEPLKIVYNPIAGVNISEVKVKASITLWGATQDISPDPSGAYDYYGAGPAGASSFDCYPPAADFKDRYIIVEPVNDMFNYSTHLSNLKKSELIISQFSTFSFSSSPFDLEYFNTQVFEITSITTQKWRDFPRDWVHNWEDGNPPTVECWWESPQPHLGYCGDYPDEVFDAIIDEKQLETTREITFYNPSNSGMSGEDDLGFLDLMFEIPVQQSPNESKMVFQHVRFPLSLDLLNEVSTEFFAEWSDTENPNEVGVYGLEEIAYFNTYDWQVADIETQGGEYLVPPTSSPAIMPSALHSVNITGSQTKDSGVAEVIFKAQDHISVYGDATLPLGFTLRIEDLVSETSIPTPTVTETELTAFCEGLGGNTYSANQRSMSADAQVSKPIKAPTPAVLASLQAYPNPTSSALNLSLLNFSGQVQFDIYNAIGNKLQSFYKILDGNRSMNYVTCATDDLPNGTYTIVARMADGTSTTEQFVVLR